MCRSISSEDQEWGQQVEATSARVDRDIRLQVDGVSVIPYSRVPGRSSGLPCTQSTIMDDHHGWAPASRRVNRGANSNVPTDLQCGMVPPLWFRFGLPPDSVQLA